MGGGRIREDRQLTLGVFQARLPPFPDLFFRYYGGMKMTDFDSLREAFAANVRTRRVQQRLTQTALARMIDVAPSYVSVIESGRMGVTFETLVKLANALETTPADLLAENSFSAAVA